MPLAVRPCVRPFLAAPVVSPPRLLTYAHDLEYTDNEHMLIIAKEVWDMPRGDGTGPAGFGPMTGRAAGYCAGYDTPGFAGAPCAGGRAVGGPGAWAGSGAGPWVGSGSGARGRGAAGVRPRAGAGPGRGHRRMYYATGMPGWMRYGCRGWAAHPAPGFRGVPQESRSADDTGGMSAEREKELLNQQAQFLKRELETVERRLSDLAGPGGDPERDSGRDSERDPERNLEQGPEQGPTEGSTEGSK